MALPQQETLRALDEVIFAAFKGAGFADVAVYGVTPCDVLVDRGVQVLGDEPGSIAGQRVVVTFQRRQVAPARGGALRIGEETFELSEQLSEDESLSTWVVQRA